jgi:hypothetical protein
MVAMRFARRVQSPLGLDRLAAMTKPWVSGGNLVQFEGGLHPTILRFSPPSPRTLGNGFGDLCGHAKPGFDCLLPVKARQGAFRYASLMPLTRLNWRRAVSWLRPLVWGGHALRA